MVEGRVPAHGDRIAEHTAGPPGPLNHPEAANHRFAFLLLPGFTLSGFAVAVDALRMANMAAGAHCFAAFTVTLDGAPVAASSGVQVTPDFSCAHLPAVDTVLVCGGNPIRYPEPARLIGWLRGLAQQGKRIGSIDSGSDLLARAGLLDGYRWTCHWQDLAQMAGRYPRALVSNRVFEIDRDRCTSGGGTAALDMMLALIGREENGPVLAAAAADLLAHDRLRAGHERQRVPLRHRLGRGARGLSEAVAIMEGTVADPLSTAEIAMHVGITPRQLERRFRRQLACTPSRYYRELRLNHARQYLLHTDAPVGEIARACGFSSTSHFARRYAEFFGVLPSEERRRSTASAATAVR